MNRSLSCWLSAALVLLCPLAARPQDPLQESRAANAALPDLPILSASDLTLGYFSARYTNAGELLAAIEGLATRSFYVRNADGSVTGPVSNVRSFGDAMLVLYDVPDRVAQAQHFLTELDQTSGRADAQGQDQAPAAPLELTEYTPRNVALGSLEEALGPLTRKVRDQDGQLVRNLTFVNAPAKIVLRDTAENIERIEDLLERIDLPAPQLMLHCWLLRGIHEHESGGLPPDLVDNLRRLVPFEGFEQVSMAVLRTSMTGSQEQQLSGQFRSGEGDERFELELLPARYDAHTQSLTLERCQFEATTGQRFLTAAVVQLGEYAVLGAAGDDPLFVVLRATPVER